MKRLIDLRFTVLLLVAVSALAGCAGGSGSSGAAEPSAPAPETPIGADAPTGNERLPPVGGGELTLPKPGQLDARDISAELLEAQVVGRSVTLRITYTSGTEPCYVLDTVVVTPGDRAFAITLREGHGPADVVCIEIAKQKHTIVELGELDPGSYTISDTTGGAAPIEVVVS